eukprot:CAMPEP_0202961012 /NCGR_PEP_ID=MMETSP1396-20130829/5116_1 /ASSEMBLY_ACC=CAM_ASM_000872 /TAXON_ID= /ORGANISM="Pseudokeronopsis sp., Strain Brazil" /LENGTH=103 /DNA_ID=CAMNT_0049680569 /DNA_START=253 /DNA_END=564 /DNA_ORIENTATION=+
MITGSFLFDPSLNQAQYVAGCVLTLSGLLWFAHDFLASREEVPQQPKIQVSGKNGGTGINFQKYMNKIPRLERDYQKVKDQTMQELNTYAPPMVDQQKVESAV